MGNRNPLTSANITGDKNEAWEMLMFLRAQTERTGTLHESQVLQLKLWPRVLFQTSTPATKFKVNIAGKSVHFDVVVTGKPFKPKKGEGIIRPEDAPVVLDSWVKSLLGQDWAVSVTVKALAGHQRNTPKKYSYARKKVVKEPLVDLAARLAAQAKAERLAGEQDG